MNKTLALVLTIIITIVVTALVGVYDYNIYYDPEGKNGSELTSDYNSYLSQKSLEIDDDKSVQTEKRLQVFEYFNNEYYSETPILKQDVEYNGKRVFTVAVYKNVVKYAPNTETNEWRYRYDIFVYNVDYEAIQNEFLKQPVPEDKTSITDAGFPTLVLNIYPNDSYDDTESYYYSTTSVINKIDLNDGEIYRSKFDSYQSISLTDWNSNPQYNKVDDKEEPFKVNYEAVIAYPTNSDNFALFNDNEAYIKIEAVCETTEATYGLDETLYQGKLEGFTTNNSDINVEDYKLGCNTSSSVREVLNNVNIKGVKKYDAWIFSKYIWWQCLIAFVVIGALSGGFFYALTVDNSSSKGPKKQNAKSNNKKSNKK